MMWMIFLILFGIMNDYISFVKYLLTYLEYVS